MTAHDVLSTLHDRGVMARIEGNRLILSPSEKLDDPLRAAIRAHKPDLLRLIAYWQALADTGGASDLGESWPDECFLIICALLRTAESQQILLARWAGFRGWLSEHLPLAAMLVLARLVASLKEAF